MSTFFLYIYADYSYMTGKLPDIVNTSNDAQPRRKDSAASTRAGHPSIMPRGAGRVKDASLLKLAWTSQRSLAPQQPVYAPLYGKNGYGSLWLAIPQDPGPYASLSYIRE
jgi:hypothetical protein